MEHKKLSDEDDFDDVLHYANQLYRRDNLSLEEVKTTLFNNGLSKESAEFVAQNLLSESDQKRKENVNNDMLWGAVW